MGSSAVFDVFVQAMLAITGVCSVFLSQCQPPWARWACIFGMLGEPFWFYTASHHGQWGIMVLACWYTFCWAKGVYTFWWLPYRRGYIVWLPTNDLR